MRGDVSESPFAQIPCKRELALAEKCRGTMQPRTRALAMTAAAAAVTCLVALVRFLELRSPDAEPVLYEPRLEKASIADTLLPTRSERIVARSSSTPKPAKTESAATKPAPAPILLAPGTLELLVLDGETPLAGARLTAVGRIEGGIDQGFIEENAHPLLATTSASGLVTWRELAPDQYDLVVRHPDGSEATCALDVPENLGLERKVVRFGTAAVHGRVMSDEGEPREESVVRLQVSPAGGEHELVFTTRTDHLGHFAFERLPAGSALAIDAHPDTSWLSPGRSVRVELGRGDVHQVELGPAERGSLCRGRLLANGAPFSLAVPVRWREAERGWYAGGRTSAQGEFELRLRPGKWNVSVPGRDGLVELAELVLDGKDLNRDLELPGGCLVVRLVDVEGQPVDGAITLTDSSGLRTQHPAPDGLTFLAGLSPGDFGLEAFGFGETPVQGRVTIADSGAHAEVLLRVPRALD